MRAEGLRFSLSDIGLKAPSLDVLLEKLNGESILNVDFSLIFPLLQYLEGLYYICEIAKKFKRNDVANSCNIVFFIPNKEFCYYLVPEDNFLFQTFKSHIELLIAELGCDFPLRIYFQPFGYGVDFYDAPYREAGAVYKTKVALDNQFKK